MAFTVFERWSPEFALNNAFSDMRESRPSKLLKGLKRFLRIPEYPSSQVR